MLSALTKFSTNSLKWQIRYCLTTSFNEFKLCSKSRYTLFGMIK
ncbi:unnamed protein product [Paramecium octaurelia]|uniref:Uncharacterized protein n=1 Tax=Paramecium octaurelia TaxID=43137 RepID=A0A8S1WGJ8_PAROT|nr:unnamed protein product [Paramecium octaurelia]